MCLIHIRFQITLYRFLLEHIASALKFIPDNKRTKYCPQIIKYFIKRIFVHKRSFLHGILNYKTIKIIAKLNKFNFEKFLREENKMS